MPGKIRYRLKVTVANPSGWLKFAIGIAPNALTFVAYDVSQTVLVNIGVANAVLAPFGISIDIELG
jgi:hypothetical protein